MVLPSDFFFLTSVVKKRKLKSEKRENQYLLLLLSLDTQFFFISLKKKRKVWFYGRIYRWNRIKFYNFDSTLWCGRFRNSFLVSSVTLMQPIKTVLGIRCDFWKLMIIRSCCKRRESWSYRSSFFFVKFKEKFESCETKNNLNWWTTLFWKLINGEFVYRKLRFHQQANSSIVRKGDQEVYRSQKNYFKSIDLYVHLRRSYVAKMKLFPIAWN